VTTQLQLMIITIIIIIIIIIKIFSKKISERSTEDLLHYVIQNFIGRSLLNVSQSVQVVALIMADQSDRIKNLFI